ncbi:MAG: hypothetical protein GTN62_04000 [Gemmatimonadales bacterium]|nr:hypothetical protein [Gemmatimonadales bacterium]NIN10470.1 hypothetical protein [Gemmatimonadales bacterium]NIN49262.1 hypothetical protein [Gemmatimonadales bacterium]NIP06726.1 hypothetical protein [Gemmatimonadales bacterium]NIR00057.1 hypothetical protein [Gemmatimonadales bacterium]
MRPVPPPVSVGRVVRLVFGTATIAFLVAAVAVRDAPGLYVAAAVFGTVWFVWDLLLEHVFLPIGDWITQSLMGGGIGAPRTQRRLSLDDTIRLLESHLRRGGSQHVDIISAIRLEEIYRTVKKDPAKARAVIELVRQRYPDAPELERYGSGEGGGGAGEGGIGL